MLHSAALLLWLALLAPAQRPDARQPPGSPLSGSLLVVGGKASAVRYVPDSLDRAIHVSKRLDVIGLDLEKRIGGPTPLAAIVLGRREWEASGFALPYGLPIRVGNATIVVAVPAAGDEGTVREWRSWLGTELPAIQGVPMVGSVEEASSLLLSDVFMQRAVCELVIEQTLLAGDEPWITGLMSQLALFTLYSRYEPSRVIQIETIFHRLRVQMPLLLELNGGEAPTERFLLRQAHLFEGAKQIYAAGGQKALGKLLKVARKSRAPLSRAALVAAHPSISQWLAGLPKAAGIG